MASLLHNILPLWRYFFRSWLPLRFPFPHSAAACEYCAGCVCCTPPGGGVCSWMGNARAAAASSSPTLRGTPWMSMHPDAEEGAPRPENVPPKSWRRRRFYISYNQWKYDTLRYNTTLGTTMIISLFWIDAYCPVSNQTSGSYEDMTIWSREEIPVARENSLSGQLRTTMTGNSTKNATFLTEDRTHSC